MSDATKYMAFAQACMDLMQRLPADARPQMLKIAEAWLELARAELTGMPDGTATPGDADQNDTGPRQ